MKWFGLDQQKWNELSEKEVYLMILEFMYSFGRMGWTEDHYTKDGYPKWIFDA